MAVRPNDGIGTEAGSNGSVPARGGSHGAGDADVNGTAAAGADGRDATALAASGATAHEAAPAVAGRDGRTATSRGGDAARGTSAETGGAGPAARTSRRFQVVTQDTARPEGGGRAAPGDAPAPARQWPLLTVIGVAGAGLLLVALDPFSQAFRIGLILIGLAMLTGAVFRWLLPSVGMLAVRSRFTDIVTYGAFGTAITLLALMAMPNPWLELPFLEAVVHFTVR
ncbi:DUF3017 domain-containing protein [Streptomyces sannanensis]|uniref:DUF3017 domain-containing protein n=1 Tax=Streptomyces sannanensis TaxID=285536 RepID=A0ABP6SEL9_9ACTN